MTNEQLTAEIGYSKVYSVTVELSDGTSKKLSNAGICQDYLNTDLQNTDNAWYDFWVRLCDVTGDPHTSIPEIHTNGVSLG